MFTNLEDQIEIYTDSTFDAKASAQRFFASYGEQEITKRLNDMSKIQQNIESVLKTSVKSQYQSFLQATEEITMVDQEMEDLKHLVSNTQKLMQVIICFNFFFCFHFCDLTSTPTVPLINTLLLPGCAWKQVIRITCYA